MIELNILSAEEISLKANALVNIYNEDLEENLIVECQHFI